MRPVSLSIVAPCYNEEAALDALYARVVAAAQAAAGDDFEIVLVNDGSCDRSWEIMQGFSRRDRRVLAINLSRNHGHQLALTAGLDLCSGERILIIDADLQDPPELLPAMIAEMEAQRADVVYGVRGVRSGETTLKRSTAKLFYRGMAQLSSIEIPADVGDFRLMSRRALDALLSLPEQARFIRGMVAWVGFKQVPFVYERAGRHSGRSAYSWSRMVALGFDAVTGFSTAPLRMAGRFGLLLIAVSILITAYSGLRWWSGDVVPGWTSLMLVIVLLGAAQMLVLGLIGEYLGRLFVEAKRRPLYIVSEIAGRAGGTARHGYVAPAPPADPNPASAGEAGG
jgi:glycosyltransferase involved in cell wall biosynthesis